MLVLESKVGNAVYAPDFGRVEAQVSLLIKTRAGQPPHWIQVRTSQPKIAPDGGSDDIADRLVADAVRLAQRMRLGGVTQQQTAAA